MTACVLGCKITGQHKTDCPGDCRGCLPREAVVGLLCQWHANRLEQAVATFAAFHHWLEIVDTDEPSAKALTDEIVSRGDPGETVPIPMSRLVADELWRDLATWGLVIIDERGLPAKGWTSDTWKGDLCAWMLPQLPWACEQMWIDELAGTWVRDVTTARHRWPTADDVQPIEDLALPCPSCGLVSLIRKPPRWGGDLWRVECTDPDCARIYDEDRYDELVALALREGKGGKWKTGERA